MLSKEVAIIKLSASLSLLGEFIFSFWMQCSSEKWGFHTIVWWNTMISKRDIPMSFKDHAWSFWSSELSVYLLIIYLGEFAILHWEWEGKERKNLKPILLLLVDVYNISFMEELRPKTSYFFSLSFNLARMFSDERVLDKISCQIPTELSVSRML